MATPPQNPRRRTRPQLTAGSGNPNCSLLVLTLAAGMREACFPCGCLGHLVAVRLCLFRRTAPPMATPGLRTQEKKGRYSAALRVAFCICLTEQKDIRKSGYLANRVASMTRCRLVRSPIDGQAATLQDSTQVGVTSPNGILRTLSIVHACWAFFGSFCPSAMSYLSAKMGAPNLAKARTGGQEAQSRAKLASGFLAIHLGPSEGQVRPEERFLTYVNSPSVR